MQIGRLSLPSGGTITLRDETVQPPFIGALMLKEVSIDNVDSTQPGSRANMRLLAGLDGGRGDISLDGWAVAFEPEPDFDLLARIDALSLPALSPILAPQTGLGIINGQLDAMATGVATDGRLKGEARATIRDLTVSISRSPEAVRLQRPSVFR